jgi:demethylmacrocin O-methyltransferase
LEISCDDASVRQVLAVDAVGARVDATSADAAVLVSFDAVDILRALFGADQRRHHDSRTVRLLVDPVERARQVGVQAMLAERAEVAAAVRTVVAACLPRPVDLGDLSVRFGSDKWADLHWYTQHYEHHFARFRNEVVKVLEIGIGGYKEVEQGGGSLRMWQRYFRRGLIYGLDIVEKSSVQGPRIRTVKGDQGNADFLDRLGHRLGPFDIVIDDGSHLNEHVRTSLLTLFRHVQPGGLYVVEDLQTAYWPGYGGSGGPEAGPTTSIGLLKNLLDGLHHQDRSDAAISDVSYLDRHVVGLHVYHNLAFVEKGLNTEEGAPNYIPRDSITACPADFN